MKYDIKNAPAMRFKVDSNPSFYPLGTDPASIIVGSTFFSESRGYKAIDVGKIVMLEINDSILKDAQKITRIA